jgi:hypothetical protein
MFQNKRGRIPQRDVLMSATCEPIKTLGTGLQLFPLMSTSDPARVAVPPLERGRWYELPLIIILVAVATSADLAA